MRLTYIQAEGFRGFRSRTRVDIPAGFAVVTGPNGAGKSALCDAVEFVLTGAIRGSSAHSERGEHIGDYLWWRGPGKRSSDDFHVEIGLRRAHGEQDVTIRRTAADLRIVPETALDELFLNPGVTLEAPMLHLCQTGILRDEDITTLSVDLKERRRFDFVRGALGTTDFRVFQDKARDVENVLAQHRAQIELEHRKRQDRVVEAAARLSEARARAARGSEVTGAEAVLRGHLGGDSLDTGPLLERGRQELATQHQVLGGLRDAYRRMREITSRLAEATTPAHVARVNDLVVKLGEVGAEKQAALADLQKCEDELRSVQRERPKITALAQLVEHGGRLGLDGGRCPLCGAVHSEDEFAARLREVQARVKMAHERVAEVTRERAESFQTATRATDEAERGGAELEGLRRVEERLRREFGAVVEEVRGLGLVLDAEPEVATEQVAMRIERLEGVGEEVERALEVVSGSQAAAEVLELEREVAAYRVRAVDGEKALAQVVRAQAEVAEAIRAMKRLQGDSVDEQLGAISPLFIELYERLRPHVDWQSVRYNLRGDVRRMLSLDVGRNLNPSFMFSSGQRRAAGLAFLIAIFLSRSWCKLQTLILDDPVQHIDDYRALHLTEVLAAVRRAGRQIVCTVEDDALAELLGRRLRSGDDDEGAVVRLRYVAGEGSKVESVRVVGPFVKHVLTAS